MCVLVSRLYHQLIKIMNTNYQWIMKLLLCIVLIYPNIDISIIVLVYVILLLTTYYIA